MSTFKFDHIHIFTRDPEGTAKWYEHMFGAEVWDRLDKALKKKLGSS